MLLPSLFLHVLLVVLIFIRNSSGNVVNLTIDDTFGDALTGARPVYSPGELWQGNTCINCAINPDPSFAFEHTWTSATYKPQSQVEAMSITFNFTGESTMLGPDRLTNSNLAGTAIYIFFILANVTGPVTLGGTECNFTLDGAGVGHFLSQPAELQYNESVFSMTGLTNEDHVFQISTSGINHRVAVNFDYAVYTYVTTLYQMFPLVKYIFLVLKTRSLTRNLLLE